MQKYAPTKFPAIQDHHTGHTILEARSGKNGIHHLTMSLLCSPITKPTCLVDMKRANAAVLSFFKDVLAISPKMIAPALIPMPSQVDKKREKWGRRKKIAS